jgi:class 3 adenylate cyclase
MTGKTDPNKEVLASVLSLDICSSSDMLEDLHRTGNVHRWRNLLIGLKNFLMREAEGFPFELYNFTGDGWLICFNYAVDGAKLLRFLRRMCRTYGQLYRQGILPLLESPPEVSGITMGMDRGRLIKIRMNNRDEYVGRPLNVACRLQGAIKDRDSRPGNKLLMTKHLYDVIREDVTAWKVSEVTRILRNIAGGQRIHCVKLEIMRRRSDR